MKNHFNNDNNDYPVFYNQFGPMTADDFKALSALSAETRCSIEFLTILLNLFDKEFNCWNVAYPARSAFAKTLKTKVKLWNWRFERPEEEVWAERREAVKKWWAAYKLAEAATKTAA